MWWAVVGLLLSRASRGKCQVVPRVGQAGVPTFTDRCAKGKVCGLPTQRKHTCTCRSSRARVCRSRGEKFAMSEVERVGWEGVMLG